MRDVKNRSLAGRRPARLRFEVLEPRHLLSASPAEGASSFDEPELGLLSDQPLTNFNWLPMVYAGPNTSVNAYNALPLISAEVLVNGEFDLSIEWTKISGPGNAVFSDSSAINATVQFDQAGTYELQLAATNHGVTASDRMFVTVSAANVINIDQAWLDAQGDGPYILDQQGKTYVLQTDVTADGTAFAIIAEDITFDLNGHTITYNNSAPINIPNGSFEAGSGTVASGWNFSGAPNATRHQGVWLHNEVYDGDYSLKFSLPAGNQHVTSTATITLEANTTYSLSAMFEYGGEGVASNPGVKGYIRLVGDGLPVREVSHSTSNTRGIQLREGTFTTGDTAETYQIQVGIEGGASANAQAFYIDDINIQRTNVYGVTAQVYGWSPSDYPGLSQGGKGTNATIKNGTIVQGADGATWAHGVFLHTIDGVTVQNLNITVHGANSSVIYGKDQGASRSRIVGNTLTSNVKTISSRDNFNGAVIYRLQGDIFNNTITNGVHSGIVTSGRDNLIYGNTIQLSSKYTNGFAIIATRGSQIYNNDINCGTGEFAARGILVTEGEVDGATTRVYDNTIHVQQLVNNQEYEGAVIGGAYGIQLENAKNVEVYGNTVFAYGNQTPASAFRMNNDGGTSAAIYVHDNTFRAIANGSHAAAVRFTRVEAEELRFEDNELITNDGFVGPTKHTNVTLTRSKITVIAPIGDPYPIVSDWISATGLHTTIIFLDTTFADASSRTYLESATTRIDPTGAADNKIAFDLRWTKKIQVDGLGGAALPGAAVTITDKTGATVASGMTGANGLFTTALTQFSTQGNTKTVFNPFTVTITANGEQAQQQFNADKIQTIQLQLSVEASGSSLQMQSLSEDPILFASTMIDSNSDTSLGSYLKRSKWGLFQQPAHESYADADRKAILLYSLNLDDLGEDKPIASNKRKNADSSIKKDQSYFRVLDKCFDEFDASDRLELV